MAQPSVWSNCHKKKKPMILNSQNLLMTDQTKMILSAQIFFFFLFAYHKVVLLSLQCNQPSAARHRITGTTSALLSTFYLSNRKSLISLSQCSARCFSPQVGTIAPASPCWWFNVETFFFFKLI